MESGAWEQGTGSRLRENLRGGDSAFICITRMHYVQYVQFVIWIYRKFPLIIVFRGMILRPLMWKDVLQALHWDLPFLLFVFCFFLILSVLGVSFPLSVRAQAQRGICAPFLASTWAWSLALPCRLSQVEPKKKILHDPTIFGGLVRLSKTNIFVQKGKTWQ